MTDQERRAEDYEERGGEAACWAHLVCPDCGAIESEGHRPDYPGYEPRHPRREQPSHGELRPGS